MSKSTSLLTRVVFGQSAIENIGLLPFIHSILEQRWNDESMRGFIFAVPAMPTQTSEPVFLNPEFNTLGHPQFICTIIVSNPGQPTVLVIMNRPYAFVKHFLDNVPCSLVKNRNIAMIAHQSGSTTIVAAVHDYLIGDGSVINAVNIPRHAEPTVDTVIKLYGTQKLQNIVENDLMLITLKTTLHMVQNPCKPSDLCPSSLIAPISGDVIYPYPRIWEFVPKSPLPDSPPIQLPQSRPDLISPISEQQIPLSRSAFRMVRPIENSSRASLSRSSEQMRVPQPYRPPMNVFKKI